MQAKQEKLPVNIPQVWRIDTDFGRGFMENTRLHALDGDKNHVLAVIPAGVSAGHALSCAYTYDIKSIGFRSVIDRGNSLTMPSQTIASRIGSLKVIADRRRIARMIRACSESPRADINPENIDTSRNIVFRIAVGVERKAAAAVAAASRKPPPTTTHMNSVEFMSRLIESQQDRSEESKRTAIMLLEQSVGLDPYGKDASVLPDKNPFVADKSGSHQGITEQPEGTIAVTAADAVYVGPVRRGEEPPRIADPTVVLALMLPGQRFVMDLIATIGTAADANVFVPGKSFHRHLYNVSVPTGITDRQADRLVASCSQRVFRSEPGRGAKSLETRSELCIETCKARCTEAADGVQISLDTGHCVVDIENLVGNLRQNIRSAIARAAVEYSDCVENPFRD